MSRQTSVEAYNGIRESGILSQLRWTVYDYIFKNGPISQRKAVMALSKESGSHIHHNGTFSSRFAELKRLGLIYEVGKAKCEFTGNNVYLWDVTGRMPRILTKKEKIQERIGELKAKIVKLEEDLKETE